MTLSPRQLDIIRLIVRGCSNIEAAEALGVSESLVKNYLTVIFRVVGVRNRVRLILWAQSNPSALEAKGVHCPLKL